MGIILFLVDTSASMNQKTYLGTSYLDVAKVAIETFMKFRMRDPASRGDRYMLVTFDKPPNAVKAGWKESHATFVSELKNLEATGLSSLGRSLKEAFGLLNIHRLHTSIDHYGQGRNPFYLEPAVIITLTDGGRMTNDTSIEKELSLSDQHNGSPEGRELTKEPFRWDQRLFSIVLRLPGLSGREAPPESTQVVALCESTGGKSYVVTSHKSLVQSMESLTQKLHPGVVVNFQSTSMLNGQSDPVPMELDGDEGNENSSASTDWHSTRKMLYVKSNPKTNVPSGFWPIPESFWADLSSTALPPRDAHPVLWFEPADKEPMLVENFPFDKYELEPSPLTQHILSRRKPGACWQVYVANSSKKSGLVHTFAYLKASSSLAHVTLFVMPFNYPHLLPLIDELTHSRMRPSAKWRQEFAEYIATVPSYYASPLRNALRLMGAPGNLINESFDGQMSYSVTSYLRKLKKQTKTESERVVATVGKNRAAAAAVEKKPSVIVELGDGISLALGTTDEGLTSQSFRNPFDIPRSGLLPQILRMRTQLLHTTSTTPNIIQEIHNHELPVGQMGNYQEHLKRISPLRELDSGAVRTQLFGNPFKLERPVDSKKVDEGLDMFADEHMVEMKRRLPRQKRRVRPPTPARVVKTPPPPSEDTPPVLPPPALPPEATTNHTEELAAFVSTSLPPDEPPPPPPDKTTTLEKLTTNSRKRERTPSPPSTHNAAKRPSLSNSGLTKFTSSALPGSKSSAVKSSSASKVLTEELAKQQVAENSRLRALTVREVRKPGKNYDIIFGHLEGVRGTVELRESFAGEVIKEAKKFKKWKLVELLEDWSNSLKTSIGKTDSNKPPLKLKHSQKR